MRRHCVCFSSGSEGREHTLRAPRDACLNRTHFMNMPPRLLRHISTTIHSGSPLWAMLTANEYLSPADPLHKALRLQVHKQLQCCNGYRGASMRLIKLILDGKRLHELPPKTRHTLKPHGRSIAVRKCGGIVPGKEVVQRALMRRQIMRQFNKRITASRSLCKIKSQTIPRRRISEAAWAIHRACQSPCATPTLFHTPR